MGRTSFNNKRNNRTHNGTINSNINELACEIKYINGILSTTIVIFISKIIVVFRTDIHKMKIKHRIIGEYATKRCFFDIKKLIIVTGS
jgi:hypothetical protein